MLRLAALVVLCTLGLSTRSSAQSYLDFTCLRGSAATCFVLFEGPIEKGLTERFEAYVEEEGVEGARLILNSPGGNLAEALKLGRLLRDWEWTTHVGSSEGWFRNLDGSLDMHGADDYPQGGRCESACAYAFMGGVNRIMGKGSLLGFHRFQAPGKVIDGDSAQAISGQLISYILEMGVDARVFVVASAEDSHSMFHLDGTQASGYDLVTPSGFAAFALFARDEGVIARSERQSPIQLYDIAERVTLFCSGGTPMVSMSSSELYLEDGSYVSFFTGVGMDPEAYEFQQEFEIDATAVTVSETDVDYTLTAELSDEIAAAMLGVADIHLSFGVAPVDGGPLDLELVPTTADRQAMAAAWKFCVD